MELYQYIISEYSVPELFFYVYVESLDPKKPRRSHTTVPKPHQLKRPTLKPQLKTPNPTPQTTINEQKREKKYKE